MWFKEGSNDGKEKQKPKVIKRFERTVKQHSTHVSDWEEVHHIAKQYLWSNAKNSIRSAIRKNPHLTEDEKLYLYYVLKAAPCFYAILTRKSFARPHKISSLILREKYVHNLLLRIVMKENQQLELHHCVITKMKQIWRYKNIVGLDKGHRTLISTSSGNLYGQKLNELLNKETERLNKVNRKRNQIWALMDKHKRAGNHEKAERILLNNFGRKKYNRLKHKHDETAKSYINFSLNQFYLVEQPSEVITEDLSFVSWNDKFPKHIKRKLSRWINYIQERIEFKCNLWNVAHTVVNAAYTSQVCHKCDSFGERKQDVFTCKKCGTMHADINASKNIKKRKTDKEINLITPYKEVKRILEKRLTLTAS
ncbi:zinc ribbon domain-containing protein [Aneurinibacillus sp. Ricciae_BoGa-3]|uniref:zinc ribbon domain-containing protein n=1 Tax=Aneurinibacillus sp. Ricciae_BoGa-3 TaxID=3022697 RepID=UPI00234008C1|nr:zinc ribbon domain-containing protein [Aneurinibacillus sp. Ricciae_BoGa-3]WCK53663.1 zinc ribbon domain-containing protein [Aneurinibacillus sp. Ricciae_BoGa-3]